MSQLVHGLRRLAGQSEKLLALDLDFDIRFPQFPGSGTREKFFSLRLKLFPIFFITWYYVAVWIVCINQDVSREAQIQAAAGHTL